MSPRPLYLHIGASKTGTSALQRGLFASIPSLAEQGIGMPWHDRNEHAQALLRPLGWVTAAGFVRDPKEQRLRKAVKHVDTVKGERVLVTCEDLCELTDERLDLLVTAFESIGAEPRVVLSVRGLASVIPSEWQQFLKHRLDLDYPTFLDRVHERKGRWAKHFWLRQDVEAICRRWSDRVGTENLDVVVTPDRATDPTGLYRIFGQTVGFDPDRMSWPEKDINASWGYVDAEVYRRVNAALGDRLKKYERDYQPAVRWPFVKGALPRGRGSRIPLPPEHLDWVAETASSHVAYLESSGIRVHGDLSLLVPGPDAAAPLPPLDEAAVASAAIETLANYTVDSWKKRSRAERLANAAPAPKKTGLLRRG